MPFQLYFDSIPTVAAGHCLPLIHPPPPTDTRLCFPCTRVTRDDLWDVRQLARVLKYLARLQTGAEPPVDKQSRETF